TVVGGLLLFGCSFFTVIDANNKQDTIQSQPNRTWGPSGDNAVAGLATDGQIISGLAIVAGSGVAIAGAVLRSRAVERAEGTQAMVTPLVSPTMAGLGVSGR